MLRLPPFSLWHCRPAPGQTEGCSVTQAQCLLPWLHVDSEPDRAKDACQGRGDPATPSLTCPCLQGWCGYNMCLFERSLILSPCPCLVPPPQGRPSPCPKRLGGEVVQAVLAALRVGQVQPPCPLGQGVWQI